MKHIMKSLVFLAFSLQMSSAATHSLQYFYTGVTEGINFPEYTAVGQVDGEPFVYYDSNIRNIIPKTDWIQKNEGEDYWKRETQIQQGTQETFKVSVATVMQRFNQTKGVHTVQEMYGCELDDDGTKRAYKQYGYDGEDFISLDLNTGTWTAANAKAVITKHKWDPDVARNNYWRNTYLQNECIEWLQKYVGYGRDTLERKVPPKVDLFQKDSSSPVVCHATGFFPRAVMISWQKNGEDVQVDVDLREPLRNQDGTFQQRSILTLSPEQLNSDEYTCVVQHGGLKKDLVLKVSEHRVLSDGGGRSVEGGVPVGVIVGVVLAALVTLIVVGVGVMIWKKKKPDDKHEYKGVSQNLKASSDTSSDTS